MKIAVIPARGGSKRIPRKNIRLFAGIPIIAHSIMAAKKSEIFDHILISSDDEEILDIAEQFGGEPLVRPMELSGDHTGLIEVVKHATEWALSQGWEVELVCCIFATAPFIRPKDLMAGCSKLLAHNASFCFSTTEFAYPIFRSLIAEEDGVKMLFPEHYHSRSQDLPVAIHDAGQFYWGTPTAWLTEERVFSKRAVPFHLPRYRVHDIDTAEDWKQAELMYQVLASKDGAIDAYE